MRQFYVLFTATCLAASAAQAIVTPEKQYAQDREQAMHSITPDLKKRCISDFLAKDKDHKPIGELVYNDMVSRGVYQQIYWHSADRGVAFTVPVAASGDPNIAGDIGCFYAVTDKGLSFELSQWLHRLNP